MTYFMDSVRYEPYDMVHIRTPKKSKFDMAFEGHLFKGPGRVVHGPNDVGSLDDLIDQKLLEICIKFGLYQIDYMI